MRLTVHVTGANKVEVMVPSKESKGTFIKKKKVFNTLSFDDVSESDVDRILNQIREEGSGIPVKHYLSGGKVPGRIRKKKK